MVMSQFAKGKAITAALSAGVLVLGLGACATKSYVRQQVDAATKASDAKLGDVQQQVEGAQTDIGSLKKATDDQGQQIGQLSDTAKEALARAEEAGKLAKGKFLFEVQLTDEGVHFPFDSAKLSPEAQQALDAFAQKLKSTNQNVYIEIQGFTDSSGPAAYNLVLGKERAEAALRYLNMQDGVPLHRMNVISYGEAKPIADNHTREGRAKNRRVTLVVLG
jgi:peptidoglycan-associated lipoprotein